FCFASRLVTAMVTPSMATTTSAVAAKILRVRPKPRGRSVALTRAPAAVLLPVLVLVLDVLVRPGVHVDVGVREPARRHGDLLAALAAPLVPGPQQIGPGGHVGDGEAAVRAGLGVPAVVAHRYETAHPRMDVAVHPHQAGAGEAVTRGLAPAIEAQVEA